MQSVIEIGKRGAEHLDGPMPEPTFGLDGSRNIPVAENGSGLTVPGVGFYVQHFKDLPRATVPYDIDGTKKDVEVWTLPLVGQNEVVSSHLFNVIRAYALFSPFVFAKKAGDSQATMGMLSPNYDAVGEDKLPSLKVLALEAPMPIVQRGSDLLPSADMAVMLSGSAVGEDAGGHNHRGNPSEDYGNKLSALGAVSLDRNTILDTSGTHTQHGFRESSSLDTALSNGAAGDVYGTGGSREGFPGFAQPITFHPDERRPGDTLYIPVALAQRDEGYGAHWAKEHDAARIKLGVALENMYNAIGSNAVSSRLSRILEEA